MPAKSEPTDVNGLLDTIQNERIRERVVKVVTDLEKVSKKVHLLRFIHNDTIIYEVLGLTVLEIIPGNAPGLKSGCRIDFYRYNLNKSRRTLKKHVDTLFFTAKHPTPEGIFSLETLPRMIKEKAENIIDNRNRVGYPGAWLHSIVVKHLDEFGLSYRTFAMPYHLPDKTEKASAGYRALRETQEFIADRDGKPVVVRVHAPSSRMTLDESMKRGYAFCQLVEDEEGEHPELVLVAADAWYRKHVNESTEFEPPYPTTVFSLKNEWKKGRINVVGQARLGL